GPDPVGPGLGDLDAQQAGEERREAIANLFESVHSCLLMSFRAPEAGAIAPGATLARATAVARRIRRHAGDYRAHDGHPEGTSPARRAPQPDGPAARCARPPPGARPRRPERRA